jgi:hypothetical protein
MADGAGSLGGSGSARDDLVAANVNPHTLLATDYLNHFNEVVMLLDMVGDVPEMMADVRAWRPCSYVDHFERSSFHARGLVIAAYRAAPPATRRRFDAVVAEIDALLVATIGAADSARGHDAGAGVASQLDAVRALIERASAIINGDAADAHPQEQVDALLAVA